MPKMQAVADTTPIDKKLFCYSCVSDQPKDYVQDRMRREAARLGPLLNEANTHMVICGLNGMESGVEAALANICRSHGLDWNVLKPEMRLGALPRLDTLIGQGHRLPNLATYCIAIL